MNLVLDASVIAKWFFKEEQTDTALTLLEKHKLAKIKINAPILLLFEFGNSVVKKFREDIDTQTEFDQDLEDLLATGINFYNPDEESLKQTYALTSKYEITFYDATYIALTQNLQCDFITADKKLYQKTKGLKSVNLLSQI
ncbi:type II toxin-antitoxin system VapC family toxin [Candidatus Curtissbacteria bacterium]|nr:type II toxin-antitoxin system VapC family toxin [Candidatus Curtissbacteria bacterium]